MSMNQYRFQPPLERAVFSDSREENGRYSSKGIIVFLILKCSTRRKWALRIWSIPFTVPFADVFPQEPDQEEDRLTETAVKQGYYPRPYIENEGISAHKVFGDRIVQDKNQILDKLRDFVADVEKKKQLNLRIPSKYGIQFCSSLFDHEFI